MTYQLTDERLAWLAAREQLRTAARGSWVRRLVLGSMGGSRTVAAAKLAPHAGGELQAEIVRGKMMRYSVER